MSPLSTPTPKAGETEWLLQDCFRNQTLVRIYRLIVRCRDPEELVSRICELLGHDHHYHNALLVLFDDKQQPAILAGAGLDLEPIRTRIDSGHSLHCVQEILAGASLVVSRSPGELCQTCPLAEPHHNHLVLTVALAYRNHLFGTLAVTLTPDIDQLEKEKRFARELADDIGYALHNLRRQRLEKELEERLEEAQEIARLGYWTVDLATGRVRASDQAYAILNMNPDNAVRTREEFRRLIHPSDRARAARVMAGFLRGANPYDLVYRVATPDGGWRYVHMRARLHRDRNGTPFRVMGVMQDVTPAKELEQQLIQSEKMATIAGLAAGVAHELNTPLSAILQSVQVIDQQMDPASDQARDLAAAHGIDLARLADFFDQSRIRYFLDGIRDSATRASRIINGLLNFSRPRQGEWQRIDLFVLFSTVVDLARSDYTLKKKYRIMDIDMVIESPAREGESALYCQPMEIEQVLLNLIKNSAHALRRPGAGTPPRIILRGEICGHLARIEVEDNGCGIEEEILPHVFEPFVTSKEIGSGTGLGLAVCYTIIHDHHQGTIEIDSRPGRATTVRIHLPQPGNSTR